MNERLVSKRAELLRGMLEYREDGDAEYSEQDVAECGRILDRYLEDLASAVDRAGALSVVRTTVLALNELNERAGEQLIETDQRELICSIIIEAGALRGFNGADEDVTEEWREW